MAKTKSSKSTDKKKKGNINFDNKLALPNTINTNVNHIFTTIELLISPEDDIVLNALNSIDAYITLHPIDMRNNLLASDLVEKLILLISRTTSISRIALKIITLYLTTEYINKNQIKKTEYLSIFVQKFLTSGDELSRGYLIYLFSYLCETEMDILNICKVEVIANIFNLISKTMDLHDQKFCLKVLLKITQHLMAETLLGQNDILEIEILICMLKNNCKEIQDLAITIIYTIAKWSAPLIQIKLKEKNIIQNLFTVLQESLGNYYLNMALDIILGHIHWIGVDIKEIESLEFLQLVKFSQQANDDIVLIVSAIITEYSKNKNTRQILCDLKIQDILIKFLNRKCDLIKLKVCEAMSYMILNISCMRKVTNDKFLMPLAGFMNQDYLLWDPYRQAPIKIIYELLKYTHGVPVLLYKTNMIRALQLAFENRVNISKSDFDCIIDIFQILFTNQSIRKYLLNKSTYMALLTYLQDPCETIVKKIFAVVYESIHLQKYRKWFVENGGIKKIYEIIQQPNNLVTQVCAFAEKFCQYYSTDLPMLHEGIIDDLIRLPYYSYRKSLLTYLIKTIYSHDLSVKFNYCDVLTCLDVTSNGFYVHVGKKPSLCCMEEPFEKFDKNRTVLLVNFTRRDYVMCPGNCDTRIARCPTLQIRRINNLPSYEYFVPNLKLKMPYPPASKEYDCYLHKYLQQVKSYLKVTATMESKIYILAQFVAKQLSGQNKTIDDDVPKPYDIDFHISELKIQLHSNVIPLGLVRYGSFMERAILFKVLADQLKLPCTLIRKNSLGWNELPVLHFSNLFCGNNNKYKCMKKYVIDLMFDVGRLMPANRWDAEAYCNGRNHLDCKDEFRDGSISSEYLGNTINSSTSHVQ